MLKALIFDFDGLILDTETPDVHAWQTIYTDHGVDFPIESWGQIIGGSGAARFDAAIHLQQMLGRPLDIDSLNAHQTNISHALVHQQSLMPGVMEMIHDAKKHELKLAIASSSPHSWVDSHAKRLRVFGYFDAVICADDVPAERIKPHPDVFLAALNRLEVQKTDAVVFEDSPNGVKAANRAGIFVVAVPNPVTSLLSLEGADAIVHSLADLTLSELARKIQ